jgi:hypothetical protein
VLRQHATVVVIAVGLAAGCAENLRSTNRAASWSTGVLFWPPPRATSSWLAEPSVATSLGEAASLVADALGRAGYAGQRWFPIGAHYEHGFAVTTRLERIDEHGAPRAQAERWLSPYPDAATLRWLAGSAEVYLPKPGHYRVLLVAFTDLHVRAKGLPERWDEGTAMEGPGMPPTAIPAQLRVPAGYRLGVHVYEYEAKSADGEGRFVPGDSPISAEAHVARSGLSGLGRIAGGAAGDE